MAIPCVASHLTFIAVKCHICHVAKSIISIDIDRLIENSGKTSLYSWSMSSKTLMLIFATIRQKTTKSKFDNLSIILSNSHHIHNQCYRKLLSVASIFSSICQQVTKKRKFINRFLINHSIILQNLYRKMQNWSASSKTFLYAKSLLAWLLLSRETDARPQVGCARPIPGSGYI